MSLQRLANAYLRNGNPLPLVGLVLADYQRKGDAPVLLDPRTGGELDNDEDPFFILSTPFEATDRHILGQHWDVSRGVDAGGPGVPVLFNHDPGRNPSEVYGQWRNLAVEDVQFNDGSTGRGLVGQPSFDVEDPAALALRGKVRRGFIPGVSVRWTPGESVRRGDLPEDDPHYREPHDDMCDEPAEGYVMGTERSPNHLVECSFTPIPADQRAVRRQATHARAMADLERGLKTGLIDEDGLSRLLTILGDDARVRRWAAGQVRTLAPDLLIETFSALPMDERRALVGLDPLPAPKRTIADFLSSRSA